jgi:glycosyltransferase involved in cell wall biosynthesis
VQVTVLVETLEHVCCRYRAAAFQPFLAQSGYRLEARPLPRTWWHWLGLKRSLSHADAVVLQRKLLPPWQLYLLRRAAPVLVFDFDDAVFLRDSYAPRGLHSARRLRRFQATVAAADAVVAGNDFLRERAGRWTEPSRVRVIPTCIDPLAYRPAAHEPQGAGVQLVWVGSSSTLQGLEAVQSLLEIVGRHVPGLSLKIICDRSLRLRHLPVIACPWSAATEAEELSAADIGISWLPDDLWSRGKCGLKVLQYMAAGLPVVANPIGVQAELVQHTVTGFLAETPRQWVEAVGRLAADPELRRRMGETGRQLVERSYSVAAGAARWRALLEGIRRQRGAA